MSDYPRDQTNSGPSQQRGTASPAPAGRSALRALATKLENYRDFSAAEAGKAKGKTDRLVREAEAKTLNVCISELAALLAQDEQSGP